MSFEYSKDLINDYEKLLEIDKGYDVIIYAGENDNMKEIYAHSFILRIRSQYFRAAFSNEWAIKKDGNFIFKKPNVSPQIFKIVLRFYQISSEDFHSKVYPFRVLLPEDLIDNILAFHATPNKILDNNIQPSRNPKYNTYIVKSQHFAIFSSWIEKKSNSYYNLKCIPYHFNLIYRASRDGFTAEAFHENCDDRGATITIVKIKGSEQIFGGFNPFDWDLCGDYKTTKNSFIFSFMDRKNMKTAKVGYSNGRCSVGCYQDYGPIFGYYLYYKNTHWMVNNDFSRNYPGIKIPISVLEITNIDDYEVFQIIKK
ncbi:unnamed protein product [Rhizophagus irregularis]|nr:unnamed protein product [Rhizophagus irregularis]